MANTNPTPVIFDDESRNDVAGVLLELDRIQSQLVVVAMAVDSMYDRERNEPLFQVSVEGFTALSATIRRISGMVMEQANTLETMPAMPVR